MSPTPTSACFVPRKIGVWGLGCLGTVAHYGASGCLPTCLEPGRDPSSELPLTQTNAGRQKIPIFLPTCVPAQALQKLPSSLQLCLIHPLAAGVRVYLGKEPLGSRLARVVDARHPVARPVWTAGGGATRPAVMDGARSGARKAIYGARAHRDRFGPAK